MNLLWQDFRYALRSMRRAPLLMGVVILALAAGIGLNAGIFSIIDSVWLRAPVAKDPATFVMVFPQYSGWFSSASSYSTFSFQDYDAFRAQSRSFSEMAASSGIGFVKLDDTDRDSGANLVTCNYFSVYGIDQPLMGRLFRPDECATQGAAPVAVMSEDFWRSYYASDPHIIGRTIRLDRHAFTVVGVVRSDAAAFVTGGLWIPYTMQAQVYHGSDAFHKADWLWLTVAARIQPGFSRKDAQADLSVIAQRQDRFIPGRKTALTLTNGSFIERPDVKSFGVLTVLIVMGPMGLVLLVACTNVTMMLLSRAAARQGEIAVRLALGASRKRLLRLLAMEGFIAAVAASAISVYLAKQIPGLFWTFVIPERAWLFAAKPNWIMFAYLAVITLLAACFAGFAPARESLKVDLVRSVKGVAGGSTRSRGRSVLVVAQIAMSFVLIAAGVLFASFRWKMESLDVGFETRHVMTVPLAVPMPPYTQDSAAAFYQRIEEQVRRLPGVQSVAQASTAPFGNYANEEIRVQGQAEGHGRQTSVEAVSPGFFQALEIPVVQGRAFQDSDVTASAAEKIALVSQAFAKAFWNGENPVGKVVVRSDGTEVRVIGIAKDTKSEVYGITDGPRLYSLLGPRDVGNPLMVRFEGDAQPLSRAISALVQKLDPEQLVVPRTLRSLTEQSAERIGRLADVVLFMGCVAIVLAVTGVYGVVAFSMSQRTREFGIRLALGASRERIVRSVLGAGARQIALGLIGGIVLATPAAYAMKQMSQNSPLPVGVFNFGIYAISGALLLAVTLVAMYVPARRAADVDPLVALRYE